MQLGVEEDRLDAPDLLPLDLDVFLGGEALAGLPGLAEHRSELGRVQVPLVEENGAGLDDRGDDPGPRHAAPHRADGAFARPLGDLADLQRELRRPGESVAALVHRRRARVRGLPAEGDLVPLHSESAEDDAERQVHRLEHRPLLDVELEVGGGVLQLAARVHGRVEVDSLACERVGKRVAVRVAAGPELVLVGHRSRGRAGPEEAPAEARSLLVRPVDQADREGRLSLVRDPAQHLDARERR